MEVIKASSFSTRIPKTNFHNKPNFNLQFHQIPTSFFSSISTKNPKSKLFSAVSTTESIDPVELEPRVHNKDEKFDWHSHWYPIAPVCDLDKRVPHAKRVLGLDVVVWWDKNENAWKVFDDMCPHRLAHLSEGRIDQWGRLQCVYHGWCFSGSGHCKFIPQAPPDGPPVHTSKRACVATYPSITQNDIVWFWPNTDPQYKDIVTKKKPPYIPELDDPSYAHSMGNSDIPYGYEILIENLMDPAHLPYAHYGIMAGIIPGQSPQNSAKADREGGSPMQISIDTLDANGFSGKQENARTKFIPPCIFYVAETLPSKQTHGSVSPDDPKKERRHILIFICVPVSPGRSRLISSFPKNFDVWIGRIVPRWIFHAAQNLIIDSDLYLLHLEEQRIMEKGPMNWQKACFVPTKCDASVVGFRKWLNKYAGGHVDWGTKFNASQLPPTPPREQLFNRYWSHTVNCSSCKGALKGLNMLEVVLQAISIASIGIIAATKQNAISTITRISLVSMAILCFAASRWLSHFIYKNFHYHDYNHALK